MQTFNLETIIHNKSFKKLSCELLLILIILTQININQMLIP